MRHRHLRNASIAVGVMLFLLVVGLFAWRSQYLKSRATLVTVGMSRADVEAILGPPYMELDRQGGKGKLVDWIDNFWQLDVLFDSNGQVESVTCVPSNSWYHRMADWVTTLPK